MQPTTPPWRSTFRQDALVCALLAVIALLLGLLVNQQRANPLPLRYLAREARLEASVAELNPAPGVAAGIRYLLPDEFAELSGRTALTVLDARPETFFQQGHIPGALPMPREDFRGFYEKHRGLLERDKGQVLVIYCQGADCEDSELVAKALSQLGFTNLNILAGGWEDWKSRQNP